MSKKYMFNVQNCNFRTVEVKGEKRFMVSGYISTRDRDKVDDVLTDNALKSMLEQIKAGNIKLDYDHEVFREDPSILPVGKIIDGFIDDTGLFVEAELNPASPKFKALWKSIKRGFVDAFSIAFKPIKSIVKIMDGVKVRVLDDLELFNVAFTGVPVNPNATITDVALKALNDIKQDEVKKMSEEKLEQMEADLKSQKEAFDNLEKENAELKSQVEKIAEMEKQVEELKSESEKKVEELKSEAEAKEKEIADLKSKVEELEKEPVLKSQINNSEPQEPELKSENKVLQFL